MEFYTGIKFSLKYSFIEFYLIEILYQKCIMFRLIEYMK